jgi:prepilin-type processing-associated H-X9-DG protein
MLSRLRMLFSLARVLLACAWAGALYGGVAAGGSWSVYWWIGESLRYFTQPRDGLQSLMEGTIYVSLLGAACGAAMGFFGALIGGKAGFVWGGALTGLCYGLAMPLFQRNSCVSIAPLDSLIIGGLMTTAGGILNLGLNNEYSRQAVANWLRPILETSPLESWPAWSRTLCGFALPPAMYLLFLIFVTWPVFWQNRNYVVRLGAAATWRQSFYFATTNYGGRRASCQSNLKQIMLAVKQYEQDYDDRLPLIVSGGATYGWADAIQPYLKSTQVYQCPTEFIPGAGNPRQSEYTDYWFNTRLSGVNESTLNQSALDIVLADGNDGRDKNDARYNRSTLPPSWLSAPNSPARRHLDGANYAFLDGHVKWYRAGKITTNSWFYAPGFSPR